MSLMLRLLATTVVASSAIFASNTQIDLEGFLENKFKQNPRITKLEVNVIDQDKLTNMDDWYAYIVGVDATIKSNGKEQNAKQKMIWFSNGTLVSPDLFDIDTGESIKDNFPFFDASYYKKENLIYGDANAKHKIAIFSDPLCPFCKRYVPKAIEDMKKEPKKFAIYYYHFPLPRLHPAAVGLTKAAIAAELQGVKDVVLKLYKVDINYKERDINKILVAFNKTMGTNITPSQLNSKEVQKQYDFDQKVANDVMVRGTPTVFLDGKKDNTKKKYKKVK